MSITDWFSQSKQNQPNFTGITKDKRPIPDGIWIKCSACNQTIYEKDFQRNSYVCPKCNHHHKISAYQRVRLLCDDATFEEFEGHLSPKDPLKFEGKKPYKETIRKAKSSTDMAEAVITGKANIFGKKCVVAVMDFSFIGGSMGSVVGEKITLAIEQAVSESLPLVIVCASGGARMQEGMFSLMQMAKTSAAIARLKETKNMYISVLTNPTTGGVTASYASLADIIIAEPGSLIGFAGPRVIEKTIGQRLPKGFQTAEFMLEYGLIDMVVSREQLKETISDLISYSLGNE